MLFQYFFIRYHQFLLKRLAKIQFLGFDFFTELGHPNDGDEEVELNYNYSDNLNTISNEALNYEATKPIICDNCETSINKEVI